jgi:hypothetical protein
MEHRKQITNIVNKIIASEWINEETDSVDELVQSYEELNKKVDLVMSKIKDRKEKEKKKK